MKTCVTCHQIKSLDDFNLRRAAVDGRQDRCRDCCRAWYVANKVKHTADVMMRRQRARDIYRERMYSYLGDHPCVDCGEDDLRVLEFDHRPGVIKCRDVTSLVSALFAWSAVEAEIAKCDVRCANCHRRRTAERGSFARQAAFEEALGARSRAAQQRLEGLRLPAAG